MDKKRPQRDTRPTLSKVRRIYHNLFRKSQNSVGEKMARKWREEEFRCYRLRQKTVTKFAKKLLNFEEKNEGTAKKKNEKLAITYGDAKFAVNGVGEHFSSPNKLI